MVDLTPQYYWHCSTAESWSTKVRGYTVTWSKHGHKNPDSQYDYSCTCPSYKFGKTGSCKHIEQVKASGDHCRWMQIFDGDEAIANNGEHHCPECGEKAYSMGWGV